MTDSLDAARPTGWAKTVFAQRRHAEAREIVRLAAQALGDRVRIMPMRGVLLSAAGFLDPSSRPLQDVDVLVDCVTLGSAVARLSRAGFRLERSRRNEGTIVLSHTMHEALWLDVHRTPLPRWFGRVTTPYLFEEARDNATLFGARVFIPSHARLMVHLIGHIVKDGIVGAYRHSAIDLAAVAEVCSSDDFDEVADHLGRLGLLDGGVLAALWAQALTNSKAIEALVQRLEPDSSMRLERWEEVTSMSVESSARAWPTVRSSSIATRLSAYRRLRRGVSRWSWAIRRSWIALRAWFVSPVRH